MFSLQSGLSLLDHSERAIMDHGDESYVRGKRNNINKMYEA